MFPSEPLRTSVVAWVAITVNMDEPPVAMELGVAVRETVGAAGGGPPVTVTMVEADVLPPAPVAVAV
jgi:hypothetical protein